jgi:hypothetical protein
MKYILMDGSKWTMNDNEGFSSVFSAVCNMSTCLPKPEVSINQIKDLMQSIDRQQKRIFIKRLCPAVVYFTFLIISQQN